ncbi:hypothetical protein D9611_005445 [Ephemerocybe angulata]|uniref:Uncharacterized protein n=1 Tax=Ephemerocybe angulata TaxID=980116 RepID=A0A8H5BZJ6_9AGAR|nr:hypothetical protein D9611_005445 [Tulosesus angulatus]
MSLAPAKKEVSSSPAMNAVVDPTNRQAMAADVDRKLRFYGVIQAFRQGRLPSNAQIHETLAYVHSHSPVPTQKLSPEGQKLVKDIREIVKTLGLIVEEKNADELIQKFIWHTQSTDVGGVAGAVKGAVAGETTLSDQKVAEDKDEAVKHLRTLFTLFLTNSEVRKLFSDFALIGQDLLSIGAAKAAEKIAPPKHKLDRVDEPAPRNQFHTADGRTVGPDETPVLSKKVNVQGKEAEVRMHPHEQGGRPMAYGDEGEAKPVGDIASEGYQAYHNVQTQGAGLAQEAVTGREHPDVDQGVRQQAHGVTAEARLRARETGGLAAEEGRQWEELSDEEKEEKKSGMRSKMREMRDNVKGVFNEKVPEDKRNQLNENVDGTKKFFTEEYFPEERRDQFIFRLKKVIIECQSHSDYQASMSWLLDVFEEYMKHGKQTTSNVANTSSSIVQDPSHLAFASNDPSTVPPPTGIHSVGAPVGASTRMAGAPPTGVMGGVEAHPAAASGHKLKTAMLELRTILERFASGVSLDVILDPLNLIIDDASRDPALRQYLTNVNAFIRRFLLEPGYIISDASTDEAKRLKEQGKVFYGEHGKYRAEFKGLWKGVETWGKAVANDELNNRLGADVARLTRDLFFDASGERFQFKPALWKDVRAVILPELIQKVGYIPIPRIEYSDDQLDLVVENLTLQGRNLLPNIIEVEAKNYVKFSPYDAISGDSDHTVTLHLAQIQADLRDVAFYFHKKTGLPHMRDQGLADILIGGNGISLTITLRKSHRDPASFFTVQDVKCKVQGLKFSVRDSKHDTLYKTLKPLMMGLVKKQIGKAVADGVRSALGWVDGRMAEVKRKVELKRNEEGMSDAQVLSDMLTRAKSDASSKAAEAESRTTLTHSSFGVSINPDKNANFKVVADKNESLIPNVGNPAGWVNRSKEIEEGKVKPTSGGEPWRSDAFSIVPSRN